jgi:hypothetical protein
VKETRTAGCTENLGVSLTKLPSEGVSGVLGHQISDQWPRTDPVGVGARLTSGLGWSVAQGKGRANRWGPAPESRVTDE